MVAKGKKRRKSRELRHFSYVVQIQDWAMSYSMHLNPKERFGPGPYWEHGSLDIAGTVIAPPELEGRGIDVIFLADREIPVILSGQKTVTYKPECVGTLTTRGQQRAEYLGSLPTDVFWTLPSLFLAEKIKFIVLYGPEPYRGTSPISSFRLTREYYPEDW
jgi:hypothetical protein